MAGFPFSFISEQIQNNPFSSKVDLASVTERADKALLSLLDGLSNGETIVGKILSVNENSFKILTDSNVVINAKAQAGLALSAGADVIFEVSKSFDNKVSLRPLYQNTSSSETGRMALSQAGIPVDARSLEMTVRNMEYGNPIDRDSLQASYKDLISFPDTPVRYIVDLQQMDIPRTPENFKAYESFMNMENTISNEIISVSDSLFEDLSGILSNDVELPEGYAVNSDTVKILDSLTDFADSLPRGDAAGLELSNKDISSLIEKFSEGNFSYNNLEELNSAYGTLHPATVLKAVLSDIKENFTFTVPLEEQPELKTEDLLNSLLPKEEVELEKEPIPMPDKQLLADLLKNDSVKEILAKTFASQWSLEKENTSEKKEIKDLFERLYTQSKSLLDNLSSIVPKDMPVVNELANISNNLDFMQALNNYVPYIQIPFRGESGSENGELYVFKNKKHSVGGDEDLTAFLHLDMTHLGATDVFVKLSGNKVSTNFTLANEETLDFIEKNLHYLDKRLADKGYELNATSKVEKKQVTPVEVMLNNMAGKHEISKFSFDARV